MKNEKHYEILEENPRRHIKIKTSYKKLVNDFMPDKKDISDKIKNIPSKKSNTRVYYLVNLVEI